MTIENPITLIQQKVLIEEQTWGSQVLSNSEIAVARCNFINEMGVCYHVCVLPKKYE